MTAEDALRLSNAAGVSRSNGRIFADFMGLDEAESFRLAMAILFDGGIPMGKEIPVEVRNAMLKVVGNALVIGANAARHVLKK